MDKACCHASGSSWHALNRRDACDASSHDRTDVHQLPKKRRPPGGHSLSEEDSIRSISFADSTELAKVLRGWKN